MNAKLQLATESYAAYENRASEAEHALRMLYAAGELKRLGADSASSECYNRASKAVGNGYSEAELKGTLYRHINQVIGEIEHLSGGDVAKQMELAERVFKSLKGPSKAAMEDRADRVQNSILAGLKMWYVALTKKHHGRFSNVDRAALQAVETAIAAALGEGDFSEAQRITGFNRQKLQAASDRYVCASCNCCCRLLLIGSFSVVAVI